MRLDSIKLAGFKSFAEPTTFQLPGQLVGVVGPNGCGKSNIMDAVRWVLGESKASELRGESMQDVIFNGSGQRKPASRASVELAFANEDGRAGGPWNRFAEIAVKRVLTRDGGSSYFINNQPVRRRDVQDVFLGTGLGPRAYAIIGQGTISRIIESRPEELRLFLEEAAGVSKYKERRRETEARLKDTRENLTRVDDILRELGASLEKLEAQAEVASRYRALQQAGETKLHQLWFLKHRDAAAEESRVGRAVHEATLALDARTAELRHGEAELEHIRQSHYAAGDALHAAQGALAEAALDVSRLEERIRYVVEGRRRTAQRLAELQAQTAQWTARRDAGLAELASTLERFDAADAEAALLAAQAEEQHGALAGADDAVRAAQQRAAGERATVVAVQQQIQVLAAESRSLAEQTRQLDSRRDRLAAEHDGLGAPDAAGLAEPTARHAAAVESQAIADARLDEIGAQVPVLDDERRRCQQIANTESARLAELGARLGALRALQEKVQTEGKLRPWLAKHGLEGLAPLWQRLHVEPGWETALEAVLRERMGALEVSRLESVQAFGADAPPARLAFCTLPSPSPPPDTLADADADADAGADADADADAYETRGAAIGLPPLADRLRVTDPAVAAMLTGWLAGVRTAASIAEALAGRNGLGPGEVAMTPEGHAVGRDRVAFHAPDSAQSGLLARAREIESLDHDRRAHAVVSEDAARRLHRAEAAAAEAALHLTAARREAADAQAVAHRLQVELLRQTQLAEQAAARRTRLESDLAELDAQRADLAARAAVGEARFETLDLDLGVAQERHAEREDAVIGAERVLAEARAQLRSLERRAQEAQFAARALVARRGELQRGIETATQQLAADTESAAQLQDELSRLTDAEAEHGLQAALAVRLDREAALGARRSDYDDLTLRLRRADEARLQHEQSLAPLRERIGRLQLEQQAAQLGGAQFLDQLVAAGVDQAAVAAGVEAGAVRLAGLQGEIDRITRELAGLGAVNLAALDELTASRERKAFLDAQNADLVDAMTTLEDAIRKIDLETRDLLANTFEQVNGHFARMFPTLFGGGTARLVMTGGEILDAGVQVMAQPPGKKNSTIHLLSGGEKALTAIALVFAIFQLNPAPFCLLDEVDAPLDDANTERYARLVKTMAQGTQFLFISHNKIAMEMAEQLIGVTMQEQGVSRIVSVDMEAAVHLAEAA